MLGARSPSGGAASCNAKAASRFWFPVRRVGYPRTNAERGPREGRRSPLKRVIDSPAEGPAETLEETDGHTVTDGACTWSDGDPPDRCRYRSHTSFLSTCVDD